MNTISLNNLWSYLQSLNLTASNRAWLADRLYESAPVETKADGDDASASRLMTMEEIDAMLDDAERDFEAGEYFTQDEVFHRPKAVAL